MLLNPDYCALVEEIGRASLGATDKTIWHLTKCYWYTVEFGTVREGSDVKAFGAGILSRCVLRNHSANDARPKLMRPSWWLASRQLSHL
jgi:phenylalanine-4-hydroxylase